MLRRVKGKFPMPTQEERIAALEQKTATAIQEIEENTTIMLGVIRSQGQDIGKIFQRLETMDEDMNQLKTTLSEHTTLLTQILARLPKTP
jgi:seryl-tRNA synthetase